MSRNLAASIRARLKRRADATRQDFNLTLTHYGLERLLYRLSISPHAGNYLLKGALLFSLWYDQPHRPTRDVDLLGMANTRMKDYFDLWVLLTEGGMDPTDLRHAVQATFARRQLALPDTVPMGLSDAFARDAAKRAQWAAFRQKNRLQTLELVEVVSRLRDEFTKLAINR